MVTISQAYFGNRLKPSTDFLFLSKGAELLASTVPMGYRNTLKLKMPLGEKTPPGLLDLRVLHVLMDRGSCMGGFSKKGFWPSGPMTRSRGS